MIKVTVERMAQMELVLPGICERIQLQESLVLPQCPCCGSADTAQILVGVVPRTLALCEATSKATVVTNGASGAYSCNSCRKDFEQPLGAVDSNC